MLNLKKIKKQPDAICGPGLNTNLDKPAITQGILRSMKETVIWTKY